eukprot:s326_g26.t1
MLITGLRKMLAVTFEHSGEEDTSSSHDESHADGPEMGARSSRTPRARSVNSRTRTDATSASSLATAQSGLVFRWCCSNSGPRARASCEASQVRNASSALAC